MGLQRFDDQVPMSEINVTPLVDVMLVLLVVFIVTAPLLMQAVKANLPRTAAVSAVAETRRCRSASTGPVRSSSISDRLHCRSWNRHCAAWLRRAPSTCRFMRMPASPTGGSPKSWPHCNGPACLASPSSRRPVPRTPSRRALPLIRAGRRAANPAKSGRSGQHDRSSRLRARRASRTLKVDVAAMGAARHHRRSVATRRHPVVLPGRAPGRTAGDDR
jgi:hypothetical protein